MNKKLEKLKREYDKISWEYHKEEEREAYKQNYKYIGRYYIYNGKYPSLYGGDIIAIQRINTTDTLKALRFNKNLDQLRQDSFFLQLIEIKNGEWIEISKNQFEIYKEKFIKNIKTL
jgi:hypothetical protein